eukprot:GFYU01009049.1.p1 GENE.GFYU01009049.1~~GFYU01009049.1.p1  ORF type:complete len:428 (-),score=61.08 GFYU01009049.1:146-1429(-)
MPSRQAYVTADSSSQESDQTSSDTEYAKSEASNNSLVHGTGTHTQDAEAGAVTPDEQHEHTSLINGMPWWGWFILFGALLAVSSAGPVFKAVNGVPAIMRASWRMQVTSLILGTAALVQWQSTDQEIKDRMFEWKTVGLLLFSGFWLGVHFGSWVWGIDNTSLSHSLLFVTMHPIVLVVAYLVCRLSVSKWEIIGAIIGFIGAAVTVMEAFFDEGDTEVTVAGDLVSFLGAVAMAAYMWIGNRLRSWMPLFLYAFPVTATGALVSAVFSFGIEGTGPTAGEISVNGLFGWLDESWIPWFAYLAVGPGILGHTGCNALLKYVSPIVISVTLLFEPIIGSLIGWAIGTEDTVPGMYTYIGGAILIGGAGCVTVAQYKLKQQSLNAATVNGIGDEEGDDVSVEVFVPDLENKSEEDDSRSYSVASESTEA